MTSQIFSLKNVLSSLINKLSFVLFFSLATIQFTLCQTTTNFGGGEHKIHSEQCISQEIRLQIIEQNKTNSLKYGYKTDLKSNVLYEWPIAQNPAFDYNDIYAISNFVDHDPVTGQLLDYDCGSHTYDVPSSGYNHQGIDMYLWPFDWNQVENDQAYAVAAAPGVIINKHDGEAHTSCSFNSNPANFVILQHADGSQSWYWHLKNGSVTSKNIGDNVTVSEILGVIASSGNSTGPHLHFECYDSNGNLVDPYAGNCNNMNSNSLWANQKPYWDPEVNAIMTHHAAPQFSNCPSEHKIYAQDVFYQGSPFYTAGYFRDQLAGTNSVYNLFDPNGNLYWTNIIDPGFDYRSSWWYWFHNTDLNTPTGTWTFQIQYANTTLNHNFQILPANNDECVNAIPLNSNIPYCTQHYIDFANATNSIDGCDGLVNDLWYEVTPNSDILSLQTNTGSHFGAELYSSCNTNDLVWGCSTIPSWPITYIENLTSGNTYYLRVWSNTNSSNFLCIQDYYCDISLIYDEKYDETCEFMSDGIINIYIDNPMNKFLIYDLIDVTTGLLYSTNYGVGNFENLPPGTYTYIVYDDVNSSCIVSSPNNIVINPGVPDAGPPTALCAPITKTLDIQGLAFVKPYEIDNASFDDCEISNMTISQTVFDCSNLGINPVDLTVFDIVGNIGVCNTTVEIIDDKAPNINCPNNQLHTLNPTLGCTIPIYFEDPLCSDPIIDTMTYHETFESNTQYAYNDSRYQKWEAFKANLTNFNFTFLEFTVIVGTDTVTYLLNDPTEVNNLISSINTNTPYFNTVQNDFWSFEPNCHNSVPGSSAFGIELGVNLNQVCGCDTNPNNIVFRPYCADSFYGGNNGENCNVSQPQEFIIKVGFENQCDNCPAGVSIIRNDGNGISSGDFLAKGQYNFSYKAIDASNNIDVCAFTIVIDDPNNICCNSQAEICDNGFDDDGDGFIDEHDQNIWIGGLSGDWHNDPCNWSLGYIPTTCDKVLINAPDEVTITPPNTGEGYTLDVMLGASLCIDGTIDIITD